MHILEAVDTNDLGRFLDATCYLLRTFHLRRFDVDHPEPNSDAGPQIAEPFELVVSSASKFQHHVVDMQVVHVSDQVFPRPLLNRLTAIVAEAQVHGRRIGDRVKKYVQRLSCPACLFGRARQVGLIELDDVSANLANLIGHRLCQGACQGRTVLVVMVEKGLAEHVRPSNCKLDRAIG
jgi:hypothetical protein